MLVAGLEEPPALKGVPQIDGEWFFPARDLLSTASRHAFTTAGTGEKRQFRRREYVAASEGDRADGRAATSDVKATSHDGAGIPRDRTDGAAPVADRTDGEAASTLQNHERTRHHRTDGAPALDDPMLIRTLQIIEEHFGQYEEVYLTPLLRKMSEILDERKYDPKTLVGELERQAAVRLEKRKGVPHDYTVLIMEEDHPDVRRVRADGRSRERSADEGTDNAVGSSADNDADDRQRP